MPVNPLPLGLIVCGAVELLVMCTVPPQATLSELGEKPYDAPLLTIARLVDEELFGHATGAVELGFGVALVFVAVGWLVALVRGAAEALAGACVGVALAVRTGTRRLADGDGAADAGGADVGAVDALAIGLGEPSPVKLGLPPPHAARASAHRARLTGRRRADISPCTHRRDERFR